MATTMVTARRATGEDVDDDGDDNDYGDGRQ